ncbi:VOC family protein [Aeromicrobium sp.]|uniref:VOC family protein n=1 Tax=Aeromicrobium sp. TaxID=1871063 RepID=UPI0019851114|nr:VOC family protein [Aeromicrobium sp.]MBC7630934.1 VOC family protein [Aeromicrobium sp.]
MVNFHTPFSGFSVDDPVTAQAFYGNVLGLDVEDAGGGMLRIGLGDGHHVLVYPKGAGHVPATFTVLNLPVDDVSTAVRELAALGVEFVRYDGMPQDEDGVMKGNGPDIAWFTDPAGNVLSIVAA